MMYHACSYTHYCRVPYVCCRHWDTQCCLSRVRDPITGQLHNITGLPEKIPAQQLRHLVSMWNMWYFWFMLIFLLFVCFGVCGVHKRRAAWAAAAYRSAAASLPSARPTTAAASATFGRPPLLMMDRLSASRQLSRPRLSSSLAAAFGSGGAGRNWPGRRSAGLDNNDADGETDVESGSRGRQYPAAPPLPPPSSAAYCGCVREGTEDNGQDASPSMLQHQPPPYQPKDEANLRDDQNDSGAPPPAYCCSDAAASSAAASAANSQGQRPGQGRGQGQDDPDLLPPPPYQLHE